MKGMSAQNRPLNPATMKQGNGSNGSSNSVASFLKNWNGQVGSGILSPALSATGGGSTPASTTVTPITPMTPLTTPRTPLQILLGTGRNGGVGKGLGRGAVGGPYRRSSLTHSQQRGNSAAAAARGNGSISEDVDDDDQYREKQLLALQLFANFLNTAETTLNDITERENSGHRVLGPGIVRVCHDLADEIEGVARELHRQHTEASRHLERVLGDHELRLIEEGGDGTIYNHVEEKNNAEDEVAVALAALDSSGSLVSIQSHEEFITTLSTTHTLLLDMAAALRAITQQEAQELGEVALEVARMFVWSLGMVHSNMIQMTVSNDYPQAQPVTPLQNENGKREDESKSKSGTETKQQHRVTWFNESTKGTGPLGLGPVVEILGEEEKKDEQQQQHAALHNNHHHSPESPTKNSSELRYTPQLSPIPASPGRSPTSSPNNSMSVVGKQHFGDRVRVLWPPLLPAVAGASVHCAHTAHDHPIPAIAIGLTCGPAAIATAAIAGPPLLIADWAIQSSYNALSEHTPVIDNVEKGAANALQVARLGILCSKLVVKQGLAVGERQVERRGGVGKICSDVVEGAVDMAMHPVETVGMAWEGVFWMGGAVRVAVGFVKDQVTGAELTDIH